MSKSMFSLAGMLIIAGIAGAQVTSQKRLRVREDVTVTRTADGTVDPAMADARTTMPQEWYVPTGATCSSVDIPAAEAVRIKTSLYDPSTMISPDSAKIVALCAVPGQIGSGEMNVANGRTSYAIDIIPSGKKTHTKVIVDANTGAVLSSKQGGGLGGLAGWVEESYQHKENLRKP